MSTVRTSSRIQARKNRLVSTESNSETTVTSGSRKRKGSKEEQASPSQQTTPAKKTTASQNVTSPTPTRIVTAPTTSAPSTPTQTSNKPTSTSPRGIPAISGTSTTPTTTMSTRSSQRSTTSAQKSDVPPKAAKPSAPIMPSEHSTDASDTTGDAPNATVTSALPVQQITQVQPPTHIFKNPNFTYSGRGGAASGKKTRTWKTLKQIIASERAQLNKPIGSTYSSIDAPPSRKPAKKYSDISGLPAKYTDPRTKLRFSNTGEFAQLSMLPQDIVNGLLALRRANLEVQ